MKIDLHRHMGGSLKPSIIWKVINSQPELRGLTDSLKSVEEAMTYKYDDLSHLTFHKFLQKFNILSYIRWNEKYIDLVIQNAIKDLSDEGIEYCELRFTIDKYLNHLPWDETEACLFVLNRIKYWSKHYNIEIGPVLCLKYETAKVNSKRISKLIHHWKVAEDVVALDFVGAESHFERRFLLDCFRHWRLCGKGLLIHAGETQSPENIRIAVEELGVNRIAHGITAAMDEKYDYILSLARNNGVAFDVALHSNFYTGVVPAPNFKTEVPYHPVVKMLMHGCNVTLGTDDPATFNITLDDEYRMLEKILNKHSELSEAEIKSTIEEVKENSLHHSLNLKGSFKNWDHSKVEHE